MCDASAGDRQQAIEIARTPSAPSSASAAKKSSAAAPGPVRRGGEPRTDRKGPRRAAARQGPEGKRRPTAGVLGNTRCGSSGALVHRHLPPDIACTSLATMRRTHDGFKVGAIKLPVRNRGLSIGNDVEPPTRPVQAARGVSDAAPGASPAGRAPARATALGRGSPRATQSTWCYAPRPASAICAAARSSSRFAKEHWSPRGARTSGSSS